MKSNIHPAVTAEGVPLEGSPQVSKSRSRETKPAAHAALSEAMDGAPVKACILGATFNTPNMGVSMLAAGAIRCVLNRFPQARVILMDYAREGYDFGFPFEGVQVPVRFVNIRFSKRVHLPNNIALLIVFVILSKLIPLKGLRERLLCRNRYLRELMECDLVFALSGGDSFSDIYGLGRFLYVTLPQFLAILAGKRLILLPQTLGPFKGGAVRWMASWIMRKAEAVYSRDYAGTAAAGKVLEAAGQKDKVRFCYDVAFDVEPAVPPAVDLGGVGGEAQTTPLVGVNVSGLLLSGGYSRKNMFGLKVDYGTLTDAVVEYFLERTDARVLLVPHVMAVPGDLESDPEACETVYRRFAEKYPGRIGVARGNYRHDEIKYVIGLCDFFTGARMHACIGAISQTIPTVPIAYSDKFAGMMETVGCGDLVVDPRKMALETVIDVLDRAYTERASIRAGLQQRIPAVRRTIRTALEYVNVAVEAPYSSSLKEQGRQ